MCALSHLALAEDNLHQARGITQVDEDHPTVIATPGHPASERDCLLDLSGAQFAGADLSGADLRGSDLSALDPRDVELTGARVDGGQAVVLVTALGLQVAPETAE